MYVDASDCKDRYGVSEDRYCTLDDRTEVVIEVVNVDELGTGTIEGTLRVGSAIRAALQDPDGGVRGDSWQWSRSSSRDEGYTPIAGADQASYMPTTDDTDKWLRAVATYSDAFGSGKTVTATAPTTVRPQDREPQSPSGVSVSETALTMTEEDTTGDRYTVALDTEPTAQVPVTVAGHAGTDVTPSPTTLTFTPQDWATAQTVTVTAGDDADTANDSVTLTHSAASTDSGYDGITIASVAPTVTDNDRSGVSVSETALTVTEEDTTGDRYTVALDTEPTAQVTVTVAGHAGTDVTPSPTTLTFTPQNWATAQTVTVTAGDDADTANDSVTLTHSAASTDSGYDGITIASVAATVTDNDRSGVSVSETALTVTEEDTTGDRYTVALDTEPTAQVTVTVAGHAGTDVTPSPTTLTFTPQNWATAQTVTVTAGDDADTANDSVTLTHSAASTDSGYHGITIASVGVTVTDNDISTPPPIGGSGGGGSGGGGGFGGGGGGSGGGGGPSPSVVDFEWNVTRDIDELDSAHDKPSGHWSDGTTLWILENGDGSDDAVYAYDLATGERVEGREFELDDTNRAPRGVWSDRTLLWVSDSGRNSLFAHDLEAGERLPERDIALAARNRAARGIWSGDGTMWVLDGGKDALFAYDLASGALLAEYELASANGDPHGLWSDQTTVWVSDHGAKRLFAYRLPVPDAEEVDGEDLELERVRDEEFPNTVLSRASNNSPRGLWSDGDVMYVVDASDGKVYTYNMPDAIDARLSSLTLSGVEFGEFDPGTIDYEGVAGDGLTVTTVEAAAVQDDAVVVIDPPDADEAAEGRQVAVGGGAEITVTVTSADGSRTKTYRVRIEETGPSATCLRGAVAEGFSLVVSEGGSIEDLVACAEGRAVTALYTLDGGEYVSYILGAPEPVNEEFVALYADGVPALTPLIAKSEGPPSPAPESDDVREFGPDCLRGEIVEGFNLVLSEGGSVDDLEACADEEGFAAVYVLHEGVWVSYILGAPEMVNAAFRELFAGGLPVATPLVVKRD